jgi:excinuclease ABC subunit C
MNEVLTRRYAQCEQQHERSPYDADRDASFATLPNVVVIDGGPGQLGAGMRALERFVHRGVAVISLAKRIEEVFVPGRPDPILLDHDTPELQLLQRVRDEAHRFAITHHRQRRDKSMLNSVLDELPGVGPRRKRTLLQHFGSPEAVLAASRDELEGVPGLPARPRATCTPSCTGPRRPDPRVLWVTHGAPVAARGPRRHQRVLRGGQVARR